MKHADYDNFLNKELKDTEIAAEYLNAALEGGSIPELLIALRNVAQAHGISELSSVTKLNRQALYKMLSDKGNPTLGSLLVLLKAVGLHLIFTPLQDKAA